MSTPARKSTAEVKAAIGGWGRVVGTVFVLGGSATMACVDPATFGPAAQSIFLLAAGFFFGQVTK